MLVEEYIKKEEVKRICKELKIRDWTELKETSINENEAEIILNIVNTQKMDIQLEDFKKGLEVELEHGMVFSDANVTNNHPIITGKIVLAHMKESLDYYKLLDVAELEGDLLKAIQASNINKVQDKYKKLINARLVLNQAILERIE
jgi:hypothetical protein